MDYEPFYEGEQYLINTENQTFVESFTIEPIDKRSAKEIAKTKRLTRKCLFTAITGILFLGVSAIVLPLLGVINLFGQFSNAISVYSGKAVSNVMVNMQNNLFWHFFIVWIICIIPIFIGTFLSLLLRSQILKGKANKATMFLARLVNAMCSLVWIFLIGFFLSTKVITHMYEKGILEVPKTETFKDRETMEL